MRHLIYCLCLLLFASCSTQKVVQKDVALSLDSLLRSERHRSFERLDSLASSLRMEFDTLEVVIERPVVATIATPETPPMEVIRVRAVKGTLNHSRKEVSKVEAQEECRDTTAYLTASTDKSVEQIDRKAVYNPPSGAALLGVVLASLLGVGLLVLWYLRKRFFR